MNSDNGESIPLDKPVTCIGGVEVRIHFYVLTCKFPIFSLVKSLTMVDLQPIQVTEAADPFA